MDAAEWVKIATASGVPEDEQDRILGTAKLRIELHPVLTKGFDEYSLAASLVARPQRSGPVSRQEFVMDDRTVWPDRATNPKWWAPIDAAVAARAAARAAARRREAAGQV